MAKIGRLNKGKVPTNAVKFIVDGVEFVSGKAAERELGITSRQLAALVKQGRAYRGGNNPKSQKKTEAGNGQK